MPRRLTAAEIEKALRDGRVRTTTSPTARPSSGPPPTNYYDKVSAMVYSLWRQPTKGDLGGSLPTVGLEITVDASGRVRAARLARRSGNAAMDASAARLAKALRELPKPPGGGLTFTVTLEVVE